jgi:hypothetical protein
MVDNDWNVPPVAGQVKTPTVCFFLICESVPARLRVHEYECASVIPLIQCKSRSIGQTLRAVLWPYEPMAVRLMIPTHPRNFVAGSLQKAPCWSILRFPPNYAVARLNRGATTCGFSFINNESNFSPPVRLTFLSFWPICPFFLRV